MKRIWLLVALITFFGHTPNTLAQDKPEQLPLYQLTTPFSADAFAWSQKPGTGVIAGQGFLRAQGGIIMAAANEAVTLVPRTAYTDEIVAATRQVGFFDRYHNVEKAPEYNQFRRVQKADPFGYFRFENLPAGEWYIVTRVIWYTRNQLQEIQLNGGLMWGLITIADGEVRDDVKLDSITELAR